MKLVTRKQSTEGIHDVNVTPIIDVSLTLVVILLLLTPLDFESTIGVRKTLASARVAPREQKEERIELDIVSEDSLLVNRRPVARADLAVTLGPILENQAEKRVVVECGGTVSHGAFVNVLDQAKLCGAGEIAVLGR